MMGVRLKSTKRSAEHLWQQLFADPSQWWDVRPSKNNPRQPDFRHKLTLESLWIDSPWNPPWVREEIAAMDSLHRIRQRSSYGNGDEDGAVQKLCLEGRVKDAVHLVECMMQQKPAGEPPKGAYVCLLKECGKRKMLREGRMVHELAARSKCDSDVFLANHLINMYSKCGSLADARAVFDAIPRRNVFSWTAVISAYADGGRFVEAIDLYRKMQNTTVAPDKIVFVVVLKACARAGALEQGKQVHSLVVKKGFSSDTIVCSALVDMYAKCGCLEIARDVFDAMEERNVVTWNAMIAGYAQNGLGISAVALYEQMVEEGMCADKVTFASVLKACASIGALERGRQIHSSIVEQGLHLDLILYGALVDMYAKCGCLGDARQVFDNMIERDVVSWNTMISGYAHNGRAAEAVALYEQMKEEGVEASNVTFLCVLKACVNIGDLEQGRRIHSLALQKGFHLDTIVQNALIDMYAKCGCVDGAREVFDGMSERDVVSWNAMVLGYAQNGLGVEAVALYEQMKQEGVQPDEITYTCVLSACRHAGLVKDGFCVFDFMCRYCDVVPTIEHYACMVDLLGRAGLFAEAEDLITKMPIQPVVVVWISLLDGARNACNAKIGECIFDFMVKLDPENAVPYLILIDIYASLGQMEKVADMRAEMRKQGLGVIPGCS